MCGHFSAIMAMVGPPTYPAPMQHTVLFERERERKRRDVSVCREKQISETRSRVYKSTCVFDHDDARFVSSGTKRTTPTTTKRVVQKILETTREKTLENNGGRSIDRFYALLVIFTISFALTTTQKGPPTTNAQSTLEYLGYYYVRKEKKRGRRRL